MVDAQLSTRLEDSIKKSFRSYTAEFEKKAKDERKRYIDLVEKFVKEIIKDEVKSQLPEILPKEVSDYATLVIQFKAPLLNHLRISSWLNQGEDLGNTDDQPNIEADSKDDWFKKPKRPATPNSNWNTTKTIDFRPTQTWISKIAKAGKPHLTFDELMSTPIDFSAYVLNNLKIENLTQAYLVGPAFNLLKGTCRSRVELEYHFEECYKAVNDQLDWTNPEGHEYPFYLSKPLPLIENQGRQVVQANYFFNNNLKYLKGESSSRKYTTSTTKTKATQYDTIEGIEDMVSSL
ncbi:hypothetical protein Tco_1464041 [Tanacetum coccineum]